MNFLAVSTTSCYFMEENFSISLFFPKKKEERKRKIKKNNNNYPPPKNHHIILACLLKILNPKIRNTIKVP